MHQVGHAGVRAHGGLAVDVPHLGRVGADGERASRRLEATHRRGPLEPEPGRRSVLQELFRRHHALQCGFCTPGVLMSLDHYLRHTPAPNETELREFLSGHPCRCTGYVPIVAAALDAAERLRSGHA